jgi:hypothetical protein
VYRSNLFDFDFTSTGLDSFWFTRFRVVEWLFR